MNTGKPTTPPEARSNPNLQSRRNQPVRLPQATASLVERILQTRCGPAH